ncbi:MAG: hypothetical protein ACE15E_12175 [Acidobacteriota bacterium]
MLWTFGVLITLLGRSAAAGAADSDLESLLERAGKSAEKFWQDLGSISCTETMSQAKIGDKGKILSQESSVYDYVIVSGGRPGRPTVEESRVLQKEHQPRRPMAFLVTSGFSVLWLVFHPYFQDSFEFSSDGGETIDGRLATRVRFSQAAGGRSLSALRLRGRLYPLTIKGEAWLDPDSGVVLRIRSSLLQPKEELGLLSLDSSVRYQQVTFLAAKKACWVPVEASVEAKTRRQHWQNTHLFANHKYFTVTSESSVSE